MNHNFVSHEACHTLCEAFIESINEDDYKNAVFQVVNGPEKSSNDKGPDDDILKLICKIYKTLEDSPISILSFIQSCTRNAGLIYRISVGTEKSLDKVYITYTKYKKNHNGKIKLA